MKNDNAKIKNAIVLVIFVVLALTLTAYFIIKNKTVKNPRTTPAPASTLTPSLPSTQNEIANLETYQSPDGTLMARIIPVKKNTQLGDVVYENRVGIQTKEGKLLQVADYTSEDGGAWFNSGRC